MELQSLISRRLNARHPWEGEAEPKTYGTYQGHVVSGGNSSRL